MSEEVVSMELPAPPGWKKQYFPKRSGTPRKNEIVFTAPTGEEIRNKRQLQQYLKAHPDGPPTSEFDWGTGETPRRSARISEKPKDVSPAESEPPKKRGRKSSASKEDTKENETADEETKMGEVEKADEEKTEHADEKDAHMEEAGKTEEEKTAGGDEKDAEIQETGETKDKEPDTLKEVATENQENKNTSTETKDSVLLDAKSEKDTSVPQAEGKKESEDRDAELKTGGQPQVPADLKDVSQEQVKPDMEEGDKEPTEIDGGGTGHKTDPVQMEKPQDKEQPPSDAVKEDSLEEPMKPDVTVDAEEEVHVDGGAKDNGTDFGLVQQPKSKINMKAVDVENEIADEETKIAEVEMKDVEKTEEEKTEYGGEKDVQIQETGETEEKELDALKEVATENQENNDTSTEMTDSVSLDAKSVNDTSVTQADDKTKDSVVIPSFVTGHETEPVQVEKPQDKEQPTSDVVKEDGLEEPMKLDMTVDAEAKVNGSDPGLVQEPKSEMNMKPVEATANGTQAE